MAVPSAAQAIVSTVQTVATDAPTPTASAFIKTALESDPTTPLSVKARLLTHFLISGTALPDLLEQHGRLLLAFTTGAAAATGVYRYFQRFRENRAKVQLGVFHIVRQLETLPDFYERLNNLRDLIADIDAEVSRMIDVHLTKDEAADVSMQVKRKLWVCVDERRESTKKQKTAAADVIVTNKESNLAVKSTRGLVEFILPAKVPQPVNGALFSEGDIQEKLLHEEEEQDVSMVDVEDLPISPSGLSPNSSPCQAPALPTGCSTYQVPSSLSDDMSSSPPPAPPQQLTPAPWKPSSPPSSGYGLDYDDETLYSPEESPTEQRRKHPGSIKEPTTMLERATQRAFDANALGNRPYESPVLPFINATEPPATIKTQVMRPRSTIKIRQPPNTMAMLSRNTKKGTWLLPVLEGASPQGSPSPGTTEYRVAERRNFYHGLQEKRRIRRTFRAVVKSEDDVKQEESEEKKDEDWPDAILTYSSTSEDNCPVDSDAPPSPPRPLDSPPSAAEISPPLPSPPNEPHTPEVSSPPRPSTPKWPSSGVNFTPLTGDLAPAVVCVAAEPVTPSPPGKKRGRPRKNSTQPQTPSKAQTPAGVRSSARKNKFAGTYFAK